MYNKASLYQEVQHLREYMGISLSDTTLDIIEYCKREYSDCLLYTSLAVHIFYGLCQHIFSVIDNFNQVMLLQE